jgi:hypothetical protein
VSSPETKMASYLGPVAAADVTGLTGVMRYATAVTSANDDLPVSTGTGGDPRSLEGKYLNVKNESQVSALEWAFGFGAAPTLVYGQLAAWGAGHASAGWNLNPGGEQSIIIPAGATHVAWIQPSGATASTIAFYVSEGKVPVR